MVIKDSMCMCGQHKMVAWVCFEAAAPQTSGEAGSCKHPSRVGKCKAAGDVTETTNAVHWRI